MSKEQCVNKKLHPYYKTGIYGYLGDEVDDNDYIICPICGEVLGMNYCNYAGEQGCNDKCPKCKQELDYSEIYYFEETCYFEQLLEIKENKISDLETKLAEKDKAIENWQTMYESVMQTCHNDKEEIERLKKQLAQSKMNESFEKEKKENALKFIEDLQQEHVREMQEHQEAMKLADKTIKDTEEQNKRVLEKLELIVSANQELEKENMELSSKVDLLESEKENLFRTLEETGEELAEKEKEIESLKVDGVLNEELEEKDYIIIKPFLKETLTIEEIKHIIKKLSDFNLRQTSFHDIQKNDVIFNAYINKHIAYKKCLDLLDLVDQDKISFAVEKLNYFKVLRGLILNMRMTGFEEYRNKIPMKYLAMADAHMEKLADIVDDQVDYQIKQLTHQHEDKGE